MHLYEQLQQHFIIPNAYPNWQEYREALTQLLIEDTYQIPLSLSFHANMEETDYLPTLLIVGAGACNDIDLRQLLPHYSHITLLDSNASAMQEAIHTYHLDNCPSITCECASLIGITDEHYMELCDELQFYLAEHHGQITPQTFAEHAITLVKAQLSHVPDVSVSTQHYDSVCCFGVHSQLLAMYSYIYHAFDVNLRNSLFRTTDPAICDQAETSYMNYLRSQNDLLMPKLNSSLIDCAGKAVWVGLERSRTNDLTRSPIEGAAQAYHDLTSRDLTLATHTLTWPFYLEGNLSYDMWIAKIILS